MTDIEQRIVVAPVDQERTAIVSVAIPAGHELPMDPTFRFEGWMTSRWEVYVAGTGAAMVTLRTVRPPAVVVLEDDDG